MFHPFFLYGLLDTGEESRGTIGMEGKEMTRRIGGGSTRTDVNHSFLETIMDASTGGGIEEDIDVIIVIVGIGIVFDGETTVVIGMKDRSVEEEGDGPFLVQTDGELIDFHVVDEGSLLFFLLLLLFFSLLLFFLLLILFFSLLLFFSTHIQIQVLLLFLLFPLEKPGMAVRIDPSMIDEGESDLNFGGFDKEEEEVTVLKGGRHRPVGIENTKGDEIGTRGLHGPMKERAELVVGEGGRDMKGEDVTGHGLDGDVDGWSGKRSGRHHKWQTLLVLRVNKSLNVVVTGCGGIEHNGHHWNQFYWLQ
jgi:hypothetical protein